MRAQKPTWELVARDKTSNSATTDHNQSNRAIMLNQ